MIVNSIAIKHHRNNIFDNRVMKQNISKVNNVVVSGVTHV